MKRGQDIELVRGDNLTVRYGITNEDGDAVDLTSATVKMTFRDSNGATKVSKTSAQATEIDITDATGGLFEMYLVPSDTSGLAGNTQYDYDVEITIGTVVSTVAVGTLFVFQDVTYTA